jgi:hypothetical protein
MKTATPKAPRHMSKIRNRIEKFPVRLARATARDAAGNLAGLEIKKGFADAAGKLVETAEVSNYAVEMGPCEDGFVARLTKDDGEVYMVRVGERGGNSCTCPAGKWGKPCKHIPALVCVALRDAQKPRMVCRDAFDVHAE